MVSCNDRTPLAQLLADPAPEVSAGTLDGRSVVVVTSAGRRGRLTAWLDPARGHLPVKVEQVKGADDLIDDGKPLRSLVQDADGKSATADAFTQTYTVTRIEAVSGRNMATGYTHTLSERYSDGTTFQMTSRITLADVVPVKEWATDPFVLSTVVPDGTPVTAQDDQPIQYVWRGGQIVKAVNQPSVASIEASTFVPPPARRPWWPWAAGAAAALLVGGLGWRAVARRGA